MSQKITSAIEEAIHPRYEIEGTWPIILSNISLSDRYVLHLRNNLPAFLSKSCAQRLLAVYLCGFEVQPRRVTAAEGHAANCLSVSALGARHGSILFPRFCVAAATV